MTTQVGSVHRFDGQSDVFHGEYRLVEDLGKGLFVAEYVEPSDALITEAEAFYLHSPQPYLGYHDPFGPERREATRQEALDQEIDDRIDRAGRTFRIRFVSQEAWAAAF
jgi:hypothetical protein